MRRHTPSLERTPDGIFHIIVSVGAVDSSERSDISVTSADGLFALGTVFLGAPSVAADCGDFIHLSTGAYCFNSQLTSLTASGRGTVGFHGYASFATNDGDFDGSGQKLAAQFLPSHVTDVAVDGHSTGNGPIVIAEGALI